MRNTVSPAPDLRRPARSPSLPTHPSLAALAHVITACRARRRFRRDLAQMSQDNPHLVVDIGLTRWQADREIAKRFWER